MNWHQVRRYVSLVLVGGILGLVLGSVWILSGNAPEWLRMVGLEIQAACRDAETQWMVMVCLVSYLVAFLVLGRRLFQPQKNTENTKGQTPSPPSVFRSPTSISAILAFLRGNISHPNLWLVGLVGIVLLRYAFAYETAARSLQPLVLLAGVVFGKGVALWVGWQPSLKAKGSSLKFGEGCNAECPSFNSQPSAINKARAILCFLVLLLACASQWQLDSGMEFQYRGVHRWTGAWDNPNLYGLLIGVGMVLAIGLFVQSLMAKGQRRGNANERHLTPGRSPNEAERGSSASPAWRWVKIILLLTAAGFCGVGLVKSYSRGAWLGTTCGLGWLLWQWLSRTHLTQNPHSQPLPMNLPEAALISKDLPTGGSGEQIASLGGSWNLSQPLGEGGVGLSPRPPGGEGEALSCHSCVSWLRKGRLPISLLLASVLIACYWQFRHTENPLARRVFSFANPNDFSWRNRVSAWQGAGRMMLDKPLTGFGWGQAEEVYGKEYRAARLEETAAIQLNDYLTLGISAGVPALVCFFAYSFLSVRRGMGQRRQDLGLPVHGSDARPSLEVEDPHKPPPHPASGHPLPIRWGEGSGEGDASPLSSINSQLSTIASSGALVLLVGFWFDGGLFKLPTTAVFWMLVELRQIAPHPSLSPSEGKRVFPQSQGTGKGRSLRNVSALLLRWLAGSMALAAAGVTALHLVIPQLAVSERTMSIARKFLVPPKAKKDFESLAAEPIWSGRKLGTLLEHVELANYNRELVNWKLDDQIYQQFVLSPQIDSALDGERDWRRPLWESLYPRIRKENNLEAAAAIVVRHLRERVKIVELHDAPRTITEIWQRGKASEREFEDICVAALRAAGIPARLSPFGQSEFGNGVEWKPAPR